MLAVTVIITLSVLFFSKCIHNEGNKRVDWRGEAYAGMVVCLNCHKAIGNSYVHTAHALTSRIADLSTVKGSFTPPGNEFVYGPGRKVVLEQRDSGLFQVVVRGEGGAAQGPGQAPVRQEAHRFDIVVGSGRKAQTYLYWEGDAVYQLPVSYFVTEHSWANSPHYPADSIWFGRAVEVNCFECHGSYIKTKPMIHTDAFHGVSQFDRAQVVYGVDCERCHGPGALHAAWQEAHPDDRQGRYIAPWASLTRQQRLDVCAVCHSGDHAGRQRSMFRFRPGDTLSNFYFEDPRNSRAAAQTDVHGNQYGLMVASKCYLQTKTLECGSCHDTHMQERDKLTVFARRCMNCHVPAEGHGLAASAAATRAPFCRLAASVDTQFLISNCVDCHMPARASRAITMLTQQQKDPVADLVRSHYITIYPEETKKRLALRQH
jgi:hypothetical protein